MKLMRVEFGPFTLDWQRRLLLRDGEPVHLFPKAFDLLQILIADRPNVVPKGVLMDRLWPSTFVADNSLATLVNDLRRALDDEARHPTIIRTVHAVGYAFVARAVEVDDASVGPDRRPSDWRLVWNDRWLPLFAGDNIVGRTGYGDIGLSDATVSRQHACIVTSAEHVTVEDLGSKNGTWVGTTRVVGPHPVPHGGDLRFGQVAVKVVKLASDASTLTANG